MANYSSPFVKKKASFVLSGAFNYDIDTPESLEIKAPEVSIHEGSEVRLSKQSTKVMFQGLRLEAGERYLIMRTEQQGWVVVKLNDGYGEKPRGRLVRSG